MKLLHCVAIFLLFSYCTTRAQSTHPDVCYKNMQEAYSNNDMTSVIIYSLQYLRLNPKSSKVWSYYASANSQKGLYWNAIEAYNKILELVPKANATLLNRSLMYTQVGYDSLCFADIEETIRYNRAYSRAYNRRAQFYMINGEIDKFFIDIKKANRLVSNTVSAYSSMGEVYKGTMNFDSAYFCLNKIIELEPNNTFALSNRALIKHYKRMPKEEVYSDCRKAIALLEPKLIKNPDNLSVVNDLAKMYSLLGKKDKSKKIVEKIIEPLNERIRLYPDSYLIRYSRAMAYFSLERESEGMVDLKKAMKMNPKCPFMQWSIDLIEYGKTLENTAN